MNCWDLPDDLHCVGRILGEGSAGSRLSSNGERLCSSDDMMLPFGVFLFFYERNKKTKLFYLIASLLWYARHHCFLSRRWVRRSSRGGVVVWLTKFQEGLIAGVGGVLALVIMICRSNIPGR